MIWRRKKEKPPTDWQRVFLASRVNGAVYLGELRPVTPWQWPRGYLSKRLEIIRQQKHDK